jgi:hypothetical protein
MGRDTAQLCHVLARDVAPLAVSVSYITIVSPGQQSTLPALRKPLLPVDDQHPQPGERFPCYLALAHLFLQANHVYLPPATDALLGSADE